MDNKAEQAADGELARECDAIAADIGAVEAKLGADTPVAGDSREPIDLTALAGRVERVCLAITALPAPRARALSERLPPLIEAFDRLAARLRDRIAAAGGRIEVAADSPDRRARAAAAYGRKGRRDR